MGAILGHIELLEYDLTNRSWYLSFRLPEILKELKGAALDVKDAVKLKNLLEKIKDEKLKGIVEEISKAIVVSEPEKSERIKRNRIRPTNYAANPSQYLQRVRCRSSLSICIPISNDRSPLNR